MQLSDVTAINVGTLDSSAHPACENEREDTDTHWYSIAHRTPARLIRKLILCCDQRTVSLTIIVPISASPTHIRRIMPLLIIGYVTTYTNNNRISILSTDSALYGILSSSLYRLFFPQYYQRSKKPWKLTQFDSTKSPLGFSCKAGFKNNLPEFH